MSATGNRTAASSYLIREPVQARARRTFEKLLDASVRILVEEGIEGLNTNKIADRAGVNIATLYSYFPNKESILVHLAQRFEDKRAASIEEHVAELGTTKGWRQWYVDSIDSMVAFRLNEPGGLAVRQALMALPDFRGFDEESTRRAAEAHIPGLMAINPNLSYEKARTISYVCTVAATAILDEAFRVTPHDATSIEEFKHMVLLYLDFHLSRGTAGIAQMQHTVDC